MGCKTILAAGASLACTTFVFADGAVQVKSGLTTGKSQTMQGMSKARKAITNKGGIAGQGATGLVDRVAGDSPTSATAIAAVPFTDSGSTAALTNSWDESCPDTSPGAAPGARDGFYVWSPAAATTLDMTMCDVFTTYDTKLSVYDAGLGIGVGASIACDDDACVAGLGQPWVSEITGFAAAGGATYYIMVDGWSAGDFGNYQLVLGMAVPCTVVCPTGSLDPDNGICGYTGTFNSAFALDGNNGCFENPPDANATNPLNCGDVYCGTTFLDSLFQVRDLDWYTLSASTTADFVVSFVTQGPDGFQMFVVDAAAGCASLPTIGTVSVGDNCTTVTATLVGFTPGDYFIIVGPFGTSADYDCSGALGEQPYILSLLDCDCGPYLTGNIDDGPTSNDIVNVDDLNVVLSNWNTTCSAN